MKSNKNHTDALVLTFMIASAVVLFFTIFSLTSCKQDQAEVVLAPIETKEPEKIVYSADWGSGHDDWIASLESSLEKYGKDMLLAEQPKDASHWCPNFEELTYEKRKQVFITLISAMAKRESGFKPETKYVENFTDSKGQKVISRGLLQISQESANQSAYKCNIKNAEDLHKPDVNLECGVKILNYWIKKDSLIGTAKLGGGRYWSVMRDTSSSQAYIKGKVLEVCKSL